VWLSVRDYANALLLRPRALRKWGHPAPGSTAARSRYFIRAPARGLSTGTSDRTKEPHVESHLTTAPEIEAAPLPRGRDATSPRREARHRARNREARGDSFAGRPRSGDRPEHTVPVCATLGFSKAKRANLVAVRIAEERNICDAAAAWCCRMSCRFVAVELADGGRVFAPPDSNREALRRYIAQREEAAGC
jgi:hypothetical protein